MKYLMAFFVFIFICNTAHAGCYVEDKTFYSESKSDFIKFAMAMDNGDRESTMQMVDEGAISACRQATCKVLEKDSPLVKVKITGIGTVWTFDSFLHCN